MWPAGACARILTLPVQNLHFSRLFTQLQRRRLTLVTSAILSWESLTHFYRLRYSRVSISLDRVHQPGQNRHGTLALLQWNQICRQILRDTIFVVSTLFPLLSCSFVVKDPPHWLLVCMDRWCLYSRVVPSPTGYPGLAMIINRTQLCLHYAGHKF